MKRVAVALLLGLAACGTQPAPSASTAPAQQTPTATAPAVCAQPLVPRPTTYLSFDDKSYQRQAWVGQHVAVLTGAEQLAPCVMTRIVGVFDRAYEFYQRVTGTAPRPARALDGRITIAVVDVTCGAGCGYLGASGIELLPDHFGILYRGVRDGDRFDQVVFYELGRNFWFYENKLEYAGADKTGAVATGYAVLMRFLAMDAAKAKGGPFAGRPFAEFRAEVTGLVDRYVADPSLNFGNTLQVGKAPANDMNLGATDLFASFIMRLARNHGRTFIETLWREVDALPKATTTEAAIDNLVMAASAAARANLGRVFGTHWRFPISSATYAKLLTRFGAPVSPQSY